MGDRGDGKLRKGAWWMEWSEKITRITQNSKPRLGDGWLCSIMLGEVSFNMMKLVRVLVKARNDHGWTKFEGVFLL